MTLINRQNFMQELRNLIYFMRPADKEATLRSYEARFDAAGPEGEAALIQELGSPVKQVVLLEKEYRARLEAEEDLPETPPPEQAPGEEKPPPAEPQLPLSTDESGEDAAAGAEEEQTKGAEEEQPKAEEKDERRRVSAGRKFLAFLVTIPLLPVILAALVIALAVGLIPLAPGAGLGACGVYLIAYGVVAMSYIPDMLMLIGAGLAGCAFGLLLIWLGLWLLILGIRLIFRYLRSIYRGILRGGEARV